MQIRHSRITSGKVAQSATPQRSEEAESGFARWSGGAHANDFAKQNCEIGAEPLLKCKGGQNMSRIGKLPIVVPAGVTVTIDQGNAITVKGPKGTLTRKLSSDMTIAQEDGQITVGRPNDLKRFKAMHGLTRTLLNNMIVGVTEGYTKKTRNSRYRLPSRQKRQQTHTQPWLFPSG
jgi:hypothetical protein